MNLIILGLFSFDFNSLIGSYYTLISHAFISSALFLLIGFLYHRYFTRNFLYLKGLSTILPIYSFFFFIFIISNISFPLTSAFPGEFLILLGILKNSIYSSILVILSLIIYTSINILLLNKILFGNISLYLLKFFDLNYYEFLCILPFFLFNFYFGIYCNSLINISYLALSKFVL
jgi:NADH-quinone oxidoreductase subunit M